MWWSIFHKLNLSWVVCNMIYVCWIKAAGCNMLYVWFILDLFIIFWGVRLVCKMHCGCCRRKWKSCYIFYLKRKKSGLQVCNSPPPSQPRLPDSQTTAGVGKPRGERYLGKMVAGGIPRQRLPTLGSCSCPSKGALHERMSPARLERRPWIVEKSICSSLLGRLGCQLCAKQLETHMCTYPLSTWALSRRTWRGPTLRASLVRHDVVKLLYLYDTSVIRCVVMKQCSIELLLPL
jgi:hypothetical protein